MTVILPAAAFATPTALFVIVHSTTSIVQSVDLPFALKTAASESFVSVEFVSVIEPAVRALPL